MYNIKHNGRALVLTISAKTTCYSLGGKVLPDTECGNTGSLAGALLWKVEEGPGGGASLEEVGTDSEA